MRLRWCLRFPTCLVFHFLEIFQVEDDALFLGQLQDGLLKKPLRFVAVKVRVAFQLVYQSGIGIVDGQLVFGALLVQEVQAFVEGDAVEPRGKLASPRK
mgnify:CR=1 FL=1